MSVDDSALRRDVQRRIAAGFTPEMAAASRRRHAVLQSLILLGLVINLAFLVSSSQPRTWLGGASAVAVVLLAALAVRGYRRLVPHPGQASSEDDLAEIASKSHRCEGCNGVILPEESECPLCGSVRHPRLTLAFGIAFGLGMTMLALWRAGVFGK